MNLLRNKIINDISTGLKELPIDKIVSHLPATVKIFVRKETIDLAIAAAQDAVQSDAFAEKVDSYIDAVKEEFKTAFTSSSGDAPQAPALPVNEYDEMGGIIDVD